MTDTQLAPAAPAKPQIVILRERLIARHDELAAALGPGTDPARFIRAVITSATINPELQACDWSSMWNACLRATRDGLLPDGNEAAIVPFKSKASYIPMFRGLLKRFYQTGLFRSVTANVVRQGEEFSHFVDEAGEHLRHVPSDDFATPVVRVYALAVMSNGGSFLAVLPIDEIEKIKKMSRATRDDSPWRQWPEEMMKKTALRRLSKLLPSGRDIVGEEAPDLDPVPTPIAPSSSPSAPAQSRSVTDVLDQIAGPEQAENPADAPASG